MMPFQFFVIALITRYQPYLKWKKAFSSGIAVLCRFRIEEIRRSVHLKCPTALPPLLLVLRSSLFAYWSSSVWYNDCFGFFMPQALVRRALSNCLFLLALFCMILLFPPFLLLYWLYCDVHGWMSCITECRPSERMLSSCHISRFERLILIRTYLLFDNDLLFDRCDDLKYKLSAVYFSSCIFPVSDRI
jgi:hypothetical protein